MTSNRCSLFANRSFRMTANRRSLFAICFFRMTSNRCLLFAIRMTSNRCLLFAIRMTTNRYLLLQNDSDQPLNYPMIGSNNSTVTLSPVLISSTSSGTTIRPLAKVIGLRLPDFWEPLRRALKPPSDFSTMRWSFSSTPLQIRRIETAVRFLDDDAHHITPPRPIYEWGIRKDRPDRHPDQSLYPLSFSSRRQ